MSIQVLDGIQVIPKGSYNISRFGSNLPRSSCFGAWIFSSSVDIGYSQQPTTIKLSLVLEAKDRQQISAVFNIKKEDLRCDAGTGADENTYDIDFNGVRFTDFILYDYEISIESNVKTLNVTFKDYSVILDKIYVGLIKRQGNRHVHITTSNIQFPVNCTDCALNGSSFIDYGNVIRDISFGSYAGINGKVYDNFDGLDLSRNIYRSWENLFTTPQSNVKFDLNGGYLILGTEDVTEEKCGDLGTISYNFNELLASLRYRGLNFIGAFPRKVNDSDFIYKQNYIGPLREVLQQWCSDLGYDFYCDGKSFVGINISDAIDISKIADITDPNSELGSNFALDSTSAIVSYKETNSITNSYKQSVITANNRARQTKTHSKSPKRYVGLLPLHPLDFNLPSYRTVTRTDLFGNNYSDLAWINEIDGADANRILYTLDGRTFDDVDSAIALTRYDADLRDIYCQDRAIYGETQAIRDANFKSLGMIPLIEVTEEDKTYAIQSIFGSSDDEVTNICLDSRYYRVYIGYYYQKFKEDVVNWEQQSAESMYKYAALAKGLLQGKPYMPPDILQDSSPYAGLYGNYGTSLTRIKHSYEPNTAQYFDLYKAPFKDLILYSGLKNRTNYLPEQIYISEISNDWGTTQEHFKRELSLRLDDACVNEFQQDSSYTNINFDIEKKYQDWKLNLFRPQVISDLKSFFETYQSYLTKINPLDLNLDRQVQRYYDLNYVEENTCAKLHIIVLTDTRTHPNISISFNKRGREFINPVVLQKYWQNQQEAIKRKATTKTPSTCEKTLLQEMCDSLITSNNIADPHNPNFSCALEDENNIFEEGFNPSYLSSANSRGLNIQIIKNPIRNDNTDGLQRLFRNSDIKGNFYYLDTIEGFNSYQQKQANLTIIYPIDVSPNSNIYYKGILTSQIDVENRSPELTEMFGEPPNISNNVSAGCRIINNLIPENLSPQLDPFSSRFINYLTVISGDSTVITSVSGYHNFIKQLNGYEVTGASKSISLALAGTPNDFGSFKNFISPSFGLQSFNISVTDNVITNLTFSDRPKVLPKGESILNSIGPRLK